MTTEEKYKDAAEYKDFLQILPEVAKVELLKGAAAFEMAYKYGLAEGAKRRINGSTV